MQLNPRLVAFVLLLTFALSSCGLSPANSSQIAAAATTLEKPMEWLLLFYGMADNNLSNSIRQDVKELETSGSRDWLLMVGQVDLLQDTSDDPDTRFVVAPHRDSPIPGLKGPFGFDHPVKTFSEIDSGHPQSLKDFIRWAARKFPAHRRALVLSGHGNGYSSRVHNENIPAAPSRGEAVVRGFSYDDHPTQEQEGHSALTTKELAQALGELNAEFGGAPLIEVVVADSCLGQTVENAYALRDVTSYYVASQEVERASGHSWEQTLHSLETNRDRNLDGTTRSVLPLNPEKFASALVEGYVRQNIRNIHLSSVDVHKLERLKTGLHQMGEELLDHSEGVLTWMKNNGPYFGGLMGPKMSVDIQTLVRNFAAEKWISPQTQDLIQAGLKEAVSSSMIFARGSVGMAHGLSLTFPVPTRHLDAELSRNATWEYQLRRGIFESEIIQGPLYNLLNKLNCTEELPCEYLNKTYVWPNLPLQ